MNKDRRKALSRISRQIVDSLMEIEILKEEEQIYYDNYDLIPERFQRSGQRERAQEAINALSKALDNLNEAIDNITIAAFGTEDEFNKSHYLLLELNKKPLRGNPRSGKAN